MSVFSFPSPFDVGPCFPQYATYSYPEGASFSDFCRYAWEHHLEACYDDMEMETQSHALLEAYLASHSPRKKSGI